MDALFVIQKRVPDQRPLLGSVYIHLGGTGIGTPGFQFVRKKWTRTCKNIWKVVDKERGQPSEESNSTQLPPEMIKNCLMNMCAPGLKIFSQCPRCVFPGSAATILQGKEIKHRETGIAVHGFEASNHFQSGSLDTLNEGDVFRAFWVENLVGVFRERSDVGPDRSMRVIWEKVCRIIRKMARAFWADFSWCGGKYRYENTQIPKSFWASILVLSHHA
ncbi:hypothetical protein T265_11228 [Opisthorchis viverrini]|uniref:Uncharacterized protein n=1 Tax=Opisthorchis viverrini TaxID=6198 RepID=A0A074ZYE8_OPIVI|nr:hypothetical protein T265_11228 [Opisthorchis viverrini]KER20164.1 hypothetical protein T265_11228 [Opisthorchis viverrini]